MSPRLTGRLARLSALGIAALSAPLLMSTAASAAGPLGSCAATQAGTTITLQADCVTTAQIDVANGVTVDGNGFSITAIDPVAGNFSGAVLRSAPGTATTPATMSVKNLTITGSFAANNPASLSGLYYDLAGGSITNVSISGITVDSGSQAGRAVEVRNGGSTTAPTLSIDGLRVRNYNKSGVIIQGKTNYTATNMDIGPATTRDGNQSVTLAAANSFTVFGGPRGTITNSKIAGNRWAPDDGNPGLPNATIAGGILVIDSPSLTITGVTVTGVDSDNALYVSNDDTSTPSNVSITCSNLTRTSGGHADPTYGQAIDNDGGTGVVKLSAGSNTFSGWRVNTEGTIAPIVGASCTPSQKATVTAKAKKDEVKAGKKIKLKGTATPALAGVSVSLQLKVDGAFKTVSTSTLPANGAFKLVTKAKKSMKHHHAKLRVVVGTGTLYAGGTSNVVKVHVI